MATGLISCSTRNVSGTANPDYVIAYNAYFDDSTKGYEVMVMDMDGNHVRNLTQSPGVEWVYAAYRDKIIYISDRDTCYRCFRLYEMDANGKNDRMIYGGILQDSYVDTRKNGTEFIVKTKKNGVPTFLIVDDKGKEVRTVLATKDYKFNDACFSPDGKTIYFRKSVEWLDELWAMEEDGGNQRQLTHYPANDSARDKHQYHAGPPRWMPSENRISFISDRGGDYDIYSITPDGNEEKRITPDGADEGWHHWSPDGKWMVYDGNELVTDWNEFNANIYLMEVATGKVKQLTEGEITEQSPVFVERAK